MGQQSRQYETTHPWLTFNIDLRDANAGFWMQLGEARSKCEHIADVPLKPETIQRIQQVYFAKGVNATTAIEGNTLSEDDVRRQIEGEDLELPPSKQYLAREVENMISAYNEILNDVSHGNRPVPCLDWFASLNKQILDGLELDDGVIPGQIRTYSVRVGPYVGVPAEDVEYLLGRLCTWLEGPDFHPDDPALLVPFAILKAVIAHVYLEWIHPFGDGNGRLGRLVEFAILISSGVPNGAAHTLTSHYNDTRSAYYRELHRASQNGGDLRAFLAYALQGFVDGLRGQIAHIQQQQEQLMWRALVDEQFLGKTTEAAMRQRALAIELAQHGKVGSGAIRTLSPELAAMYASKTSKTITRDVNRLVHMGFVGQVGPIVWARMNVLLSGLRPFKADPDHD